MHSFPRIWRLLNPISKSQLESILGSSRIVSSLYVLAAMLYILFHACLFLPTMLFSFSAIPLGLVSCTWNHLLSFISVPLICFVWTWCECYRGVNLVEISWCTPWSLTHSILYLLSLRYCLNSLYKWKRLVSFQRKKS